AEVFFGGEDAESGARPITDFGGVGAEEARGVDDLAVGDGVVLADVVAFDAVAPGAGFSGRAEDGEVIFFGVAALAAVLFLNAEDVFEAHDGNGLHESGLAEPGADERAGEVLLVWAHLAERESFALDGDAEPV